MTIQFTMPQPSRSIDTFIHQLLISMEEQGIVRPLKSRTITSIFDWLNSTNQDAAIAARQLLSHWLVSLLHKDKLITVSLGLMSDDSSEFKEAILVLTKKQQSLVLCQSMIFALTNSPKQVAPLLEMIKELDDETKKLIFNQLVTTSTFELIALSFITGTTDAFKVINLTIFDMENIFNNLLLCQPRNIVKQPVILAALIRFATADIEKLRQVILAASPEELNIHVNSIHLLRFVMVYQPALLETVFGQLAHVHPRQLNQMLKEADITSKWTTNQDVDRLCAAMDKAGIDHSKLSVLRERNSALFHYSHFKPLIQSDINKEAKGILPPIPL